MNYFIDEWFYGRECKTIQRLEYNGRNNQALMVNVEVEYEKSRNLYKMF